MDDGLRRCMERLPEEFPDADERLGALGDLIDLLYSYDPIPDDHEDDTVDAHAHHTRMFPLWGQLEHSP